MLRHTLGAWGGKDDLWVFAYGSLIWNPEFEPVEVRQATVFGWHRALRMWSRINRGTPEQPGLVLALLSGGSCKGMALRLAAAAVPEVLPRLWAREMVTGVYDPLFVKAHTAEGTLRALTFTLSRQSPSFTGELSDDQLASIMQHSCGRYGTTRDYVEKTAACLRAAGLRDTELEALVRRHCSTITG